MPEGRLDPSPKLWSTLETTWPFPSSPEAISPKTKNPRMARCGSARCMAAFRFRYLYNSNSTREFYIPSHGKQCVPAHRRVLKHARVEKAAGPSLATLSGCLEGVGFHRRAIHSDLLQQLIARIV
jgi:hypothetical protein